MGKWEVRGLPSGQPRSLEGSKTVARRNSNSTPKVRVEWIEMVLDEGRLPRVFLLDDPLGIGDAALSGGHGDVGSCDGFLGRKRR